MSTPATINGTAFEIPAKDETEYSADLAALLAALPQALATVITFGATSGISSGSDRFARPGMGVIDTTEVFWVAPMAGKVSNLRGYGTSVASGGNVVATVRKNGSDSALTITVAGAAQSAADAVNSFTVVAGDRVSFRVTGGSGYASGLANFILTAALTPS